MNKNTLYNYILKNKNFSASRENAEGNAYVVLSSQQPLPNGCKEHHISVYDRYTQMNIAKNSQYHYTATLHNEEKVRVYFDSENNVINVQAGQSVDKELFVGIAKKVAEKMVYPIKKELKKQVKDDSKEVKRRLAELSEISVGFPEKYGEWDEKANDLISWFLPRKEMYKEDSYIVKQLEFIVRFLNREKYVARALSNESDGIVSPEMSAESDVQEEACLSGLTMFQEENPLDKMQKVLEEFKSVESMSLEDLKKRYIIMADIELLLDNNESKLLSPECFSKFYKKVGELAKDDINRAILGKKLEGLRSFLQAVSLEKIDYDFKKILPILFRVSAKENLELIKLFVEAGYIDLETYNIVIGREKITPMQYAFDKGNKDLMAYLVDKGVSLLSIESKSGLPFFYVLFSVDEHPCKEVIFSGVGLEMMKNPVFLAKVNQMLEERGEESTGIKMLQNICHDGSGTKERSKVELLFLFNMIKDRMLTDFSDLKDKRVVTAYEDFLQAMTQGWDKLKSTDQRRKFQNFVNEQGERIRKVREIQVQKRDKLMSQGDIGKEFAKCDLEYYAMPEVKRLQIEHARDELQLNMDLIMDSASQRGGLCLTTKNQHLEVERRQQDIKFLYHMSYSEIRESMPEFNRLGGYDKLRELLGSDNDAKLAGPAR